MKKYSFRICLKTFKNVKLKIAKKVSVVGCQQMY